MIKATRNADRLYIGGAWIEAHGTSTFEPVNPATEGAAGVVRIADRVDVDRAVAAAREAFENFSQTTVAERVALLRRIANVANGRQEEMAMCVTAEMGAPISFSKSFHARGIAARFEEMAEVAANYPFSVEQGTTLIAREAIGVCGAITPWNIPVTSIAGKLAPALAAGCAVVVKPSEVAPFSPLLLAEILHDAGVPPGVVNFINGDGLITGASMASHPDIDLINFTGSTRAGVAIGKAAAETVKRVLLELGGKSPNILLPDAELDSIVPASVQRAFVGSGQSCQAPTRLLVHRSQHDYVTELASAAAAAYIVGDPTDSSVTMGPVASRAQFDKVTSMISAGIDEGATLAAGGLALQLHID